MELATHRTLRLCDSIVLRQFCRLYLQSAPDDTTLIRWANTIGAPTLAALNDRAVELAGTLKVSRGRKLRTDATVVQTNIHHPTDDALIADDGVRLISRLVRGAKGLIPKSVRQAASAEPFRNRTPSAKRLAHKISKMALRRTQEAKATYREAYQRLIEVGRASIMQAERVQSMLQEAPGSRRVPQELSHFAGLLERVISQSRRRVLEGEEVPPTQKLLSVFEEHTAMIRRGKARKKQTEFGRKVWLSEVDGGIISGFRILWRVMPAMKPS